MKCKNEPKLFSPDAIANALHQALHDDLGFLADPLATVYSKPGTFHYTTILATRQLNDFQKKYIPETPQRGLDEKAFQSFIENNDRLGSFNLELPNIDVTRAIWHTAWGRDKVLIRARQLIHQILGELRLEDWFEKTKHSSGTTVGVKFSDTSLEAKTAWPITCTEECYPYFKAYLLWDTKYHQACYNNVVRRRKAVGKPDKKGRRKLVIKKEVPFFKIVKGSRLSTVDKKADEKRTISPEPTANMFMQLGLMDLMYDLLRIFGLDITKRQDVHRYLAKIASIFPARLSTLDFKKASDCVMLLLVEWLFPTSWFDAINAVRSPFVQVPGRGWVELNMISTMGNATTFPIETLVFYAIAAAAHTEVHHHRDSTFVDPRSFGAVSVYGDDVILPTDVSNLFIDVCESAGFIINKEKSFYGDNEGFRESCGADFYSGHNVGIYNLRNPVDITYGSLEAWLYIILNRLILIYDALGVNFYNSSLWAYVSLMFDSYNLNFKVVPVDYPDDSGFRYMQDLSYLDDFLRFSPLLQDRHGCIYFTALTFDYSERKGLYGLVRLWDSLKKRPHDNTLSPVDRHITLRGEILQAGTARNRRIRSGGSYIESRGLDTRFVFNTLSNYNRFEWYDC